MAIIFNMKDKININEIEKASNLIKEGKLVLFPTETVYGIGADGLNEQAVKNIFIAKGRAQDNPLILHVSSFEMIKRIVKNINTVGPLTIILERTKIVPDVVTGGLDTVGVRMPSNIIAKTLIEKANTPIAAPSANISGKPSGTNIKDIFDELNNKVDCIIDGGNTDIGLESTVVRVIDNKVKILRPGKITKEQLEKQGFNVEIDNNVFNKIKENDIVLSPGMKYKHYAPNKKCLLIYSDDNKKFIEKVHELEKESNILVVCKNNNTKYFENTIAMGNTLEEISHNIFTILRQVDKTNASLVVIEGVNKEGLGLAIMNRLIRACSHNYIEIKKDK